MRELALYSHLYRLVVRTCRAGTKVMRKAATTMAAVLLATASAASAGPQEEAVRRAVKAVRQGEDLAAAFPGAISAADAAALQRASRCAPGRLKRLNGGRYIVIFKCGSNDAVAMEMRASEAGLSSISAVPLERRPSGR